MTIILNWVFVIFFLYFFFYCYGDHRDLHSFPTRRSSDLSRCVMSSRWVASPIFAMTYERRMVERPNVTLRRHRDRKSTRLNSSHVEISYAVFCLKKKKTELRFQNGTHDCNATLSFSVRLQ